MFLRKEKSSLIISWKKSLFSKELSLKEGITKNKILNLAFTPINDKKDVIMQWRWKEMLLPC